MRVITFSKVFPAYHPRKGQPTDFVNKILAGTKVHTIRPGNRWTPGDKFSARTWSDKPYRSPQREFAEMEVIKTWTFELREDETFYLDGKSIDVTSGDFARNDGLDADDLLNWFPIKRDKSGKVITFTGQVICWDESVNY